MPKSAQFFPDREELASEQGTELEVFSCPFCGLVQTSGAPVPYYKDVIRSVSVSREMRQMRRKQFFEWVSSHGLAGKRVIEVGCGTGELLEILEETGAKAAGIEHSAESVSTAAAAGRTVYEGFVEDENSRIPGAPYDGFLCMNYLEHLPEPRRFLRGIAENLTDSAWGLIEVPNLDMILKRDLYSEFIQDHLSYFTADTLCRIISDCGFEVFRVETTCADYNLSAVVQKRRMIGLQSMENNLSFRKRKVQEYLMQQAACGHHIAAWGAGHQALANIALLEMDRFLDCVIDSAPFKQNKYTPATHLPVVAPDILEKGSIQTVIITAGVYADEIRAALEANNPGIHIAILGETFEIIQ